jgi:hypothetical protein
MANWIDSIMSPLHAAGDVAKGLVDIRDTVKFGQEVIKLQNQILAAQRGALGAQARETEQATEIRDLRDQLTKLEAWEAEKLRYRMVQLPPSVFVQELIPEKANGEPLHYICQTCFQRGKKSILHGDQQYNGIHHLECHECGTKYKVGHFSGSRFADSDRGGSWMSR